MKIKKVKDEKGSTMVLAIVCISLLFIFITLITNQLVNNMKNTNNNYNNIKSKYIAEAGVERSISEIYNFIMEGVDNSFGKYKSNTLSNSNNNIDHSNHNFMPNSKDNIDMNDYWNYIILDLLEANTGNGVSNDELNGDTLWKLSTNEIWESVIDLVSKDEADKIRRYLYNIRDIIYDTIWSNGKFNWNDANKDLLEKEINYTISELDRLSSNINGKPDSSNKNKAIDIIKRTKNVIIEIKCRLKMNLNIGSIIEKTVEINIPNYKVYIKDLESQNLEFEPLVKNGVSQSSKVQIEIKIQGNKVISIDFSQLNNIVIKSEGSISKEDKPYKIDADVDFEFKKYGDNDYSIEQNIKEYKKVN